MKKTRLVCGGAVLSLALAFSACETPEGQGAAYGGAAGAAIGGIAGGSIRSTAIGAAAGMATGALIGHAVAQSNDGHYQGRSLPYGRYVGPGLVKSPYYPYSVIDVRGIHRGAVVEDPTTGRLFVRP